MPPQEASLAMNARRGVARRTDRPMPKGAQLELGIVTLAVRPMVDIGRSIDVRNKERAQPQR